MAIKVLILLLMAVTYSAGAEELPLSFQTLLRGNVLPVGGGRLQGVGFVESRASTVYVQGGDGTIALYDLDKRRFTEKIKLKSSGFTSWCSCSWSPSGKLIAYLFERSVYVYDVRNRSTSKIDVVGYIPPTKIVWKNENELFFNFLDEDSKSIKVGVFNLSNNRWTTILSGNGSHAVEGYSPTGSRFFYSHSRKGDVGRPALIMATLVDAILVTPEQLIGHGEIQTDSGFQVTRDGRYIVYAGRQLGEAGRNTTEIDAMEQVYLLEVGTKKKLQFVDEKSVALTAGFVDISADGAHAIVRAVLPDEQGVKRVEVVQWANIPPH